MSRPWLKFALTGAAVGVGMVALIGAGYGGVVGIQLSLDDGREYQRPTGLDGAFLGAILFGAFGGLPAAILGAFGGIVVSRYRKIKAPTQSPTA